jgi:putative lipoprotein
MSRPAPERTWPGAARRAARLLLLATVATLAGCAIWGDEQPAGPRAEVTGTVTYRQRIALPPQAMVRVSLNDVSRADAPAELIARATIATHGRQVPIAFALPYDPSRIDPGAQYAVDARIESEGRLLYVTTQRHLVITGGHPVTGVVIEVDPPGRPGR